MGGGEEVWGFAAEEDEGVEVEGSVLSVVVVGSSMVVVVVTVVTGGVFVGRNGAGERARQRGRNRRRWLSSKSISPVLGSSGSADVGFEAGSESSLEVVVGRGLGGGVMGEDGVEVEAVDETRDEDDLLDQLLEKLEFC